MNLSFRPALETDAPLISALAHKIWKEHYPSIISEEQINYMLRMFYSPEELRASIGKKQLFVLAFLGDEAVAYASVQTKDTYHFISRFYVDVSHHRSGIGRELLDYLLSHLDSSKPIRLQVNRQNIKAINFYFKMGFIIEKAADFEIGSGFLMNDFVMVRKGT